MYAQICPQHPDEFVQAVVVNDDGLLSYTCDRAGHVTAGDFVWSGVAESNATESISGLLPAAIAQYPGKWIEYGVVEAAYAQANPEDFAHLIQEHGHRAIKPSKYTISKYLASILGILGRNGAIAFQEGFVVVLGLDAGVDAGESSLCRRSRARRQLCARLQRLERKRSTSENRSSSPRQ